MQKNTITAIVLGVVALAVIGGGWWLYQQYSAKAGTPIAGTETWQTVTDTTGKVLFRYPADLGSEYVSTVDWPPMVRAEAVAFSCAETGDQSMGEGQTMLVTVGGREYCRTIVGEGAAGSTYLQYAYAFAVGTSNTGYLTFTVQEPQCMNYDEPKQTACKGDQSAFNPDNLADLMIRSIR